MLILDGRKDKPFHCSECGDSEKPCGHWTEEEKRILDNWKPSLVDANEVIIMTWYEYEAKHKGSSVWVSTPHHADTLEDLNKRQPFGALVAWQREEFEYRIVRKTLTTEVI